jgi:HPt (histidine-containing phosphotransfer) domain-containing protein
MGDSIEMYIDTVKLTMRSLPETIDKMDKFLEAGDIKGFTVEAHGVKSVLKSIGATSLGSDAAQLENAGIESNASVCKERYPSFRAALVELGESLKNALPQERGSDKAGDVAKLVRALIEAQTAAENFDRDLALELLAPLAEFTYTVETDALLEEIVSALEAFDCEGAAECIGKLLQSADDSE